MTTISGTGGAGPVRYVPNQQPAEGARFALPLGPSSQPAGAAATGGVAAVALDAMLAMQEAESAAVRDRQARRHGQALLAALARLQHDLLRAGADAAGSLHELAELAGRVPEAADPGLQAVLLAIATRARVELARRAR